MADEINISKIQIDMSGLISDNADYLKQMAEMEASQKALRKSTDNLANATAEQRKAYAESTSTLKNLKKSYRDNEKVISDTKSGIAGLTNAIEKQVKTEKEAKKNNEELKKARQLLNTETDVGRKKIEEINSKMDENNKVLNENRSKYEGLRGAIDQTVPGLGGMISGIQGATKSALAFIATPLGAVLAIIVGALGAIGTALKKYQAGMDLFNKITEQGSAILEVITGRIVKFGTGLIKLLSGNLDGLSDLKDSFTGIGEEIETVVEEAGKLAELKIRNEEARISSIELISQLVDQSAEHNRIANDATLSLQEQQDAAEKAAETDIKLADTRIKGLQRELDEQLRINSLKANLTREDAKRIAELRAAVTEAETAKGDITYANAQRIRQIDQDTWEQRLDFLIDGFDNFKTNQERIFDLESTTNEQRAQILADLTKEYEKNQEQQMKLFEEQTNQRIDLNELIMISDQEELFNKIKTFKLSEIENTRLLEAIRERRTFERDLAEKAMELSEKEFEQEQEQIAELERQREQSLRDKARLQDIDNQLRNLKNRQAFAQEIADLEAHNESMKNIELARIAFEEQQALSEIEADKERRLQEIELSKESEEVKAAERLLVNAEVESAITEITQQASNERMAIEEAERQRRLDLANEVLNTTGEFLNKLSEINQAALDTRLSQLDKEKSKVESRYDAEIAAAKEAGEDTTQIEKEKQEAIEGIEAKAIEAQKKFDKEQEKIRKANAVKEAIAFTLKAGANFGIPGLIVGGILSLALLEAQGVTNIGGVLKRIKRVVKRFGSKRDKKELEEVQGFAKGTPSVEGPGTTTSDSILARLSRKEAVIPANRNMQYPGLSKAMIDGTVNQWFNSSFSDKGINKHLVKLNQTLIRKRLNATVKLDNYTTREYGHRR